MASENITLKVLLHRGNQKVLYAEAPKEFVDLLLHFLSLRMSSVISLVGSKEMVGGLGKFKESIESVNQIYFQPAGINKDNIFNSKTVINGNMFPLLDDNDNDKPAATSTTTRVAVYTCSLFGTDAYSGYYCRSATENPATLCPTCNGVMNVSLHLIGQPPVVKEAEAEAEWKVKKGGFVKDVGTYMVMDDLEVKPMSTISSIAVITTFGVKDLSQLEERTLIFGKEGMLKLLRASLSTKEVLTTIFRQSKPV